MRKRDYRDYVQDILDSISETKEFTAGFSFEDFRNDRKTQNAVIRSIEVMGEAAKKIPPSLRRKHAGVPWQKMSGMRDKLIHEYSGVDMEIVWQAIKEELPAVKPLIARVLKELEHKK